MLNKKDILKIKALFLEHFKDASSELIFKNNYELIVCVILSAQCTDKRVNLITPALFEKYPSVFDLANAKLSTLKNLIQTCSFFNNKANNLIQMAKAVVSEFGGEIPLNEKDLLNLAGVGIKTAHVVLIEAKGANFMAVDTHVFRVSHRLNLTTAKTPELTDKELTKLFKTDLNKLHQAMIWFGRQTCKAINPKCNECFLNQICPSFGKFN